MSYTCNNNGNCQQSEKDQCGYHDEKVRPWVDDVLRVICNRAHDCAQSLGCNNGNAMADFETAYWRGVEQALEVISERLQRLRRERDHLLSATEAAADAIDAICRSPETLGYAKLKGMFPLRLRLKSLVAEVRGRAAEKATVAT